MSYRERDVIGLSINGRTLVGKRVPVTVRITADGVGKTLSLSTGENMILIPLESVSDLIKVQEENKK